CAPLRGIAAQAKNPSQGDPSPCTPKEDKNFGFHPKSHDRTAFETKSKIFVWINVRLSGHFRLSKKLKFVTIGGPAPTMGTPTGKFCGKLCARSEATSARFAAEFCRERFQKGEPDG
ncbi:hypothetical protein MR578_09805, partial [bacterium]|nr:hypothetical protein [bacterium]